MTVLFPDFMTFHWFFYDGNWHIFFVWKIPNKRMMDFGTSLFVCRRFVFIQISVWHFIVSSLFVSKWKYLFVQQNTLSLKPLQLARWWFKIDIFQSISFESIYCSIWFFFAIFKSLRLYLASFAVVCIPDTKDWHLNLCLRVFDQIYCVECCLVAVIKNTYEIKKNSWKIFLVWRRLKINNVVDWPSPTIEEKAKHE